MQQPQSMLPVSIAEPLRLPLPGRRLRRTEPRQQSCPGLRRRGADRDHANARGGRHASLRKGGRLRELRGKRPARRRARLCRNQELEHAAGLRALGTDGS